MRAFRAGFYGCALRRADALFELSDAVLAARVAWESGGYVVAGAATQAVATQNLQAEAGIGARTMVGWRLAGLTGVDVLVLDEASLTDDRDRAWLYGETHRAGTKLVEVGDPRQLRGVGCGSVFAPVHQLDAGPALTENRRQRDEDERGALAAWRDGRYTEALGSGPGGGHRDAARGGECDGRRLDGAPGRRPGPAHRAARTGDGGRHHRGSRAAQRRRTGGAGRYRRARPRPGLRPAGPVRRLVADQTRGRLLGFLGQPRVNVLELNLVLARVRG